MHLGCVRLWWLRRRLLGQTCSSLPGNCGSSPSLRHRYYVRGHAHPDCVRYPHRTCKGEWSRTDFRGFWTDPAVRSCIGWSVSDGAVGCSRLLPSAFLQQGRWSRPSCIARPTHSCVLVGVWTICAMCPLWVGGYRFRWWLCFRNPKHRPAENSCNIPYLPMKSWRPVDNLADYP